ncbi:2TM domain-containing protein [Oxalobacteraceae bacterium OM1]|nr:2TM domain-containing protein [Oxalobacteraceae bacterium OM1]
MQEPRYEDIRRHAGRKIGLYVHALTFAVITAGLCLINLVVTPDRWWAQWPMFGWGIGLLFHAIGVFLNAPAGWKERLIEKEVQRYRERS